jgi:hypothetical protein
MARSDEIARNAPIHALRVFVTSRATSSAGTATSGQAFRDGVKISRAAAAHVTSIHARDVIQWPSRPIGR